MLRDALLKTAKELHPGYFALVMATGIVSIASSLLGVMPVAWVLFVINLAAYAVLWLLTGVRLARFFPNLLADLSSHSRGPGFLSTVAATCTVGSQFVLLAHSARAGLALWLLGGALWLLLTYAFLVAVFVDRIKPNLEEGLNGAWLIAVVATQSVAILGLQVAGQSAGRAPGLIFLSLALFLLGSALYLLLISLIFYRLAFFPLTPREFTPPYWINMGAIAITTLSGATLIQNAARWPFLQRILPFLDGYTLLFWVLCTWWIPLLVALEAWRHLWRGYPVRYGPDYWDIAFPLGMYATCTFQMHAATGLPYLSTLSRVFACIALLVWALVFSGLLHRLWLGCRVARRRWPAGG
ncbi:MAG: tellurite resistance/C4-dicarboxylate transporter family protein [Chthonomonadales bacterium]|nr:tellurite resistance/C4-dicarboxylate transporter family protein [Chthonomonadales bacterium]